MEKSQPEDSDLLSRMRLRRVLKKNHLDPRVENSPAPTNTRD